MISGLIDELRKSADEWNGSNMFELARMCSDAADTIWELRDDLQRTNAAVQDAEHDESMAWDRVRKAEAENVKLRKQVERLHAEQAHWELGNCPHCPNVVSLQEALEQNARLRELIDYMTPIALYVASEQERNHMRELGIEVDE